MTSVTHQRRGTAVRGKKRGVGGVATRWLSAPGWAAARAGSRPRRASSRPPLPPPPRGSPSAPARARTRRPAGPGHPAPGAARRPGERSRGTLLADAAAFATAPSVGPLLPGTYLRCVPTQDDTAASRSGAPLRPANSAWARATELVGLGVAARPKVGQAVGRGRLRHGRPALDGRLVLDEHPAWPHRQHVRAPPAGDNYLRHGQGLPVARDRQAFPQRSTGHVRHRQLENHLELLVHLDLEMRAHMTATRVFHANSMTGNGAHSKPLKAWTELSNARRSRSPALMPARRVRAVPLRVRRTAQKRSRNGASGRLSPGPRSPGGWARPAAW